MNSQEIRQQLINARDEYIELIKAELMGPGSEFSFPDAEHELISSNPLSRYSVGILFPQGNKVEQSNDDTIVVGEDWTAGKSEETVSVDQESDDSFSGEAERTFIKDSDDQAPDDSFSNEKGKSFLQEENDDDFENLDEEINMATQYKPSSMGITFLVKGKADEVRCKVSFATYRRAKVDECLVPYEPDNVGADVIPEQLKQPFIKMAYDKHLKALYLRESGIDRNNLGKFFENNNDPEVNKLKSYVYKLSDFQLLGHVREQHSFDSIPIVFGESDYASSEEISSVDDVNVKLVALRTRIAEDAYSLTVMLVNEYKGVPVKTDQCLFQSRIEISTQNNDFVFAESNSATDPEYMDDEEKSLELLYRNKRIYATGLGVSADWEISDDGSGKIWTDYFPIKEVPATSFSLPKNDYLEDDELSMKYLSDLNDVDRETKLDSLTKLIDLYVEWIEDLKRRAESLDSRHRAAAFSNIDNCERIAERMIEGIETLRNNDNAFHAFLLANRAMFMQRVHIQKQRELFQKNADRYPDDEEISEWLLNLDYRKENDDNCRWRPFQIAFLLLDVNSIVNDKGEDRSLLDLIWFPTGGGKTEAYLGLTAFTIFYRRLAYPNSSGGTTVMMRYTLRLLAAQQFARASTLICACEYIRQDSLKERRYKAYPLGDEPITIGLWIGGSHIPNKNTGDYSAETFLKNLKDANASSVSSEKRRSNKFQVLKCPWCGTKLERDAVFDRGSKKGQLVGQWGYSMRGKHFYMFCPHEDCDFTKELPIQIIDEELYEKPPTMLFATVDKLAMIAWEGRVGSLFGLQSSNRSPELIIQDELHLISGALGTIVGLYETAVDGLTSMKGVKPKIIASTATIRRAKEQCSVLYNREVVQFPAPGLDAEDSFFAREEKIDYSSGKYGRKYVGIMPSGRTKAMTEIRSMSSLLQRAFTMELPDDTKDKLWTLTAYFNSLKDVGKAFTLVQDSVVDFIGRLAKRTHSFHRSLYTVDELTSRITTTELNETLDKLEKVEYSKEKTETKRYPSDVLLATNMISVGIDVARLNVMLVVGQPKLTSEYIQATSRVGRSYPGIAFVQYDATRSRDRSHYEQFRAYHDSFYRFVEPTGVTPFSKPARERALHAVVTALLRHKESLVNDEDAGRFNKKDFNASILKIKEYISERIREINVRTNAVFNNDDVDDEIDDFIDFCQKAVEHTQREGEKVCFGKKYMMNQGIPDGSRRLFKTYYLPAQDDAKETLTSMRNVDRSICGSVIIWEDING